MNIQLRPPVDAYVGAINRHDAAAFIALFGEDAVVEDIGREFRGLAAIKAWSDREIFAVQVTLDVTAAAEEDGETVFTAKVDGTFDRTGLPDPLLLVHRIKTRGGRIVGLKCGLVGGKS